MKSLPTPLLLLIVSCVIAVWVAGHVQANNLTSAEDQDEDSSPSFAGILSGLFDSLTATAETNDCPGKCVHSLTSAFMCDDVTDAECPNGLRCCVERPPPPPPPANHFHGNQTFYPPPPPHMRYPGGPWGRPPMPPPGWRPPYGYPPYQQHGPPPPMHSLPHKEATSAETPGANPVKSSEVTSSEVANKAPAPDSSEKFKDIVKPPKKPDSVEDDEKDEVSMPEFVTRTENVPLVSSTVAPLKKCPGICAAVKYVPYCDGVLNIPHLCSTPSMKCCVSEDSLDFNDPPPELIIMKPNRASEKPNIGEDDEVEDAKTATTSTSTTTTSTTTPRPPPTTTVALGRDSHERPSEEKDDEHSTNNNGEEEFDEPEEEPPVGAKRCQGKCVYPLLSNLFCNHIDRSAWCKEGSVCCVDSPPQDHRPPNSNVLHRPPQPMPQQRPKCRAYCLPGNMFGVCSQPIPHDCAEGYFCCLSPPPPPPPQNRPYIPANSQQQPWPPQQQQPSFMGPQRHGPPMLHHPQTPPTTTTTTTTTEYPFEDDLYNSGADDLLDENTSAAGGASATLVKTPCPGSCIAPLFQFTCFRNAEISDLFTCDKPNTKCCAPKTALKEYQDNATTVSSQSVPSTTPASPISKIIIGGGGPKVPPVSMQSLNGKNSFNVPSSNNYPHPPPQVGSIRPPGQQQHQQQQHSMLQPPPQPSQNNFKQNFIPPQNPQSHHHHMNPPPKMPTPPPHQQQQPPPQFYAPYNPPNQQPSQALTVPPVHSHQNHPNHQSAGGGPPTSQPPPLPATPNILPQQKPSNRQPSMNRYVCGVKGNSSSGKNRVKRVVGGEDALPGEWCWQVALINSLNQYLCGGALIGTQWVLTAAHCVTNIVRSGDPIYVRVGDHDLTSKYGSPGAQTLRVATTYIHHNHNSQTLDNDIALLKLQGQVAIKDGVCLVCLPARGVAKETPGKRCTVTGYGYMGESGPIPLRVREAILPIVSEAECVRKVNAVTEKVFVLPASSFCAGGEYKNDACQGDGGGPLVCQDEGFYELTGLVSWGFGCGRENVPGVYVKVSSFIGWINQIISVNNN